MRESISKYGFNDEKTVEISRKLDKMILEEMNKDQSD